MKKKNKLERFVKVRQTQIKELDQIQRDLEGIEKALKSDNLDLADKRLKRLNLRLRSNKKKESKAKRLIR